MITLANNGVSEWSAARGSLSENADFALSEFLSYFRQISGVSLPVKTYEPGGKKQIVIGGECDKDLGDDGFIITAEENTVRIAGPGERGTMYGVYSFFEDYLGCRWLTSDVKKIPKRSVVEIPEISRREKPVLEYRDSFFTDMFKASAAAPNKINGASCALDARHGGKIEYRGFVHTFYPMIPPETYFATHPEYYSEIDGVRTADRAQLCLTNPDVLKIVIENVKKGFRDNPYAKIASVSQNDWYNNCQCPKCRAIDEEEGSPMGSLLRFVNAVADAVRDEFPDRYIDTLAYQYTRKPPKLTRPRDNVIIRLCSIECCFSHSFEKCAALDRDGQSLNGKFVDDMKAWAKIADNIYIWDYVVDFSHYLMPFPNFRVLKDNIKFLIAHNVKGIFEEGCYNTERGEFAELRGYVLAKLLWNPDCDVDAAINEFLTGYYGMAAAPIRAYIDLLHDRADAENTPGGKHFGCFAGPTEDFFTADFLAECDALFDRAERLADDDDVLRRVRAARLAPEYVKMHLCQGSKEEKRAVIERWFDQAAALGVTKICEWKSIADSRSEFLEALDK